jgi:hypothetical protein
MSARVWRWRNARLSAGASLYLAVCVASWRLLRIEMNTLHTVVGRALVATLLISLVLLGCTSSEPTRTLTPPAIPQHTIAAVPAPIQHGSFTEEELHLHTTEGAFLQTDATKLALEELDPYIKEKQTVPAENGIKWTLHIPDRIDIDLALQLFQTFADKGCTHVAVYSEEPSGDWPKRDIGVEVGPHDPVRVITQFKEDYPEPLQQYTGAYTPENLLVAKVTTADLEGALMPLLAIADESHVRVQEVGGLDGMPAARYLEILAELERLGVTVVSFYGVFIE